jgi:hypothetical protein
MRIDPRGWLRLPLPTLALGLLVLAMGVAIMLVLIRGTRAEILLATPARQVAPFEFSGELVRRPADLAAIQAQPLLHTTRAFYQKPVQAAPVAPPRPDYRLAGAMLLPGKTPVAVVVSRAGGGSKRVKPGDDLDGWRVDSINRSQVVLAWGTERAEITSAVSQSPTAASTVAANGSGGLKRVPITRSQVTATGGVQTLGATGNSAANAARGGPYNDAPRQYRPPPQ